jgi:hypothetical protein
MRILEGLVDTYATVRHSLFRLGWALTKKAPDAIIFGETHESLENTNEQIAAIRQHRPEFFLSEKFDQLNPEDTKDSIDTYKVTTLEEIAEAKGVSLEDMGIIDNSAYLTEQGLLGHKNVENKYDIGTVPKSYDNLVRTPLYEFKRDVIHSIVRFFTRYSHELRGTDLGEKIEGLDMEIHQGFMRDRGENPGARRLYRALAETGVALAGCDIDKSDAPKQEKGESIFAYDKRLSQYIEAKNAERERGGMGGRIAEFVGKRKTDAPVIASVGDKHLEAGSGVIRALRRANVNYEIRIQNGEEVSFAEGALYTLKIGKR